MNPFPPPGKRMPLIPERTYQIGDHSTTREDKSNECFLRGTGTWIGLSVGVTASPQPPIPPGLFGHEIVSGYFGSSLRSSDAFRGISPVRQRSSVVCNQGFYRIMEGATGGRTTDMRFVAVAAASNAWSDGDGGGEERATKAAEAGDAREKGGIRSGRGEIGSRFAQTFYPSRFRFLFVLQSPFSSAVRTMHCMCPL